MVFLSLSTFSFSLLFACQHGWNFTFYLLYILPLLAIVTVVTARYQASRYYYYILSTITNLCPGVADPGGAGAQRGGGGALPGGARQHQDRDGVLQPGQGDPEVRPAAVISLELPKKLCGV